MDLLKFVARRSFLSEIIYVLLNLALAIGVWLLVAYFGTPWLAYGLILVSKWRVLSVRPRFWFANIQANAVDVLVGLGFATLLAGANGFPAVQTVLTLLFVGWLLYLKPRSTHAAMGAQALVANFVALSALFALAYNWDTAPVVLIGWAVGYSVARHILSSYEEKETVLLSFIWGFVVAELVWVTFHWNVVYGVKLIPGILIPQVAIITTILGYVAGRFYLALGSENARQSSRQLLWPSAIGGVIVLLVLLQPLFTDLTRL